MSGIDCTTLSCYTINSCANSGEESMNTAVSIYLMFLIAMALAGVVNPRWLLSAFHSFSRLLNVRSDNASLRVVRSVRIVCLVFFIFGCFVLGGMLSGRVSF